MTHARRRDKDLRNLRTERPRFTGRSSYFYADEALNHMVDETLNQEAENE